MIRTATALLCASCLLAAVASGLTPTFSKARGLTPASSQLLGNVYGAGNDLCCAKDAGGNCSTWGGVECLYSVFTVDCINPGAPCENIVEISKADKCIPGNPGDNCLLAQINMCTKSRKGICKDEEVWSWFYGEWMCGCGNLAAPGWVPNVNVAKCDMSQSNDCTLPPG